jgi:hypothetical protein
VPGNADHETVREILARKLAKIKQAPLPRGAPSWADIAEETWKDVKRKARQRKKGYATFRKLLTDARFDK